LGKSRNAGESNPFYGKKHTLDSRAKMSLAQKGKRRPPRSREWCERISESKKGTKMGADNPFFGKTHTLEIRKVISDKGKNNPGHRLNGARHPNWQGGITNPRRSQQEKRWSAAVRERDSYICQKCGLNGTTETPVEAHHIRSFARHPELRFDISNGLTLCLACHQSTDTFGGKKQCRN